VLGLPDEAEVLAKLTEWADREDAIRALILTSSRARADATVDALSDYDVIVAVSDVAAFLDDEWVRGYDEPLASWGDRHDVLGLESRVPRSRLRRSREGSTTRCGRKRCSHAWPRRPRCPRT
jgi:hypothetical protein